MRATSLLRHITQALLLIPKSKTPQPQRTMASITMMPQQPKTIQDHGVPVTLPPILVPSVLEGFIPYQNWRKTLSKSLSAQSNPSHPFHKDPYQLRSIEIQAADFFGSDRLGFLKLKAHVTNSANEHFPGSVFMRGGSVAMLIVLSTKSQSQPQSQNQSESQSESSRDEQVILTIQPRIPAGSLSFIELPAGMIDDSGTFSGAAAKEIQEETGLDIKEDELIDMTRLAIQSRNNNVNDNNADEPHLQEAIYPSPGGSDEFIPIFLVRKSMSSDAIEDLKGKLTGLRDHGEKITLRICPLRDLWKVAARDGKTLAALALYEGLKREGRL